MTVSEGHGRDREEKCCDACGGVATVLLCRACASLPGRDREEEIKVIAAVFAQALGDEPEEWMEEAREAAAALDRVRAGRAQAGLVKRRPMVPDPLDSAAVEAAIIDVLERCARATSGRAANIAAREGLNLARAAQPNPRAEKVEWESFKTIGGVSHVSRLEAEHRLAEARASHRYWYDRAEAAEAKANQAGRELAEARASIEACRKTAERVETSLRDRDEARASLELCDERARINARYAGKLAAERDEAIVRAEKAEQEARRAWQSADQLATTVAEQHERAETAAERSLSTAREALEAIIGEFDERDIDPVLNIARRALASLAGGEHRAGPNEESGHGQDG